MTNLQDTPSGGLLTAEDFDRQLTVAIPPARYAACATGTCMQGRLECPTPEACQLPDEDDKRDSDGPEGGSIVVTLMVAVLTIAAVVVYLLGRLP